MEEKRKRGRPKKSSTQKQYQCSKCGAIIPNLPTITIEKPIEKIVEVPIEKIVEKKVEIPVEKIVYKDKIITDDKKIKEQEQIIQSLQTENQKLKTEIQEQKNMILALERRLDESNQLVKKLQKPKIIGPLIRTIDDNE